MSTPPGKNSKRAKLLEKVWDLGRKMSTQTVFLHQAIAQTVGLNATDTKCIELISRAGDEPVTPGWIGRRTGLSSGAVTHILDRLEKRRYIERVRDAKDRRKIFIRLRPDVFRQLAPKYEPIGRASLGVADQYSDRELELVCRFMEQLSEISQRELERVIAQEK